MDLRETARQLPDRPGIYQFLDSEGEILYIGRATSLKRRVANYFRSNIDPRIAEMVSLAHEIRHREMDSVLDAIVLEANLIKQYWPKYNVLDKNNKSFTYIVIPKVDFAKPLIVRGRELEKFPTADNQIFGPYQSQYLVRRALKIIRRLFPYSTCKHASGKPCFDYQLGLCPGSCIEAIDAKAYRQNIRNMIEFLSGNKQRLIKRLMKSNPETAQALEHIYDVPLMTRDDLGFDATPNRIEAYDISHLTGREVVGAMTVFTDGVADSSQYRLFNIRSVANNDIYALTEMLERRFRHSEWPLPKFILIDGGRPQIDAVSKLFDKLHIAIPFVGLSKFAGDELIFPASASPNMRELANSIKRTLQAVRDEAHRFGRQASRRQRGKITRTRV